MTYTIWFEATRELPPNLTYEYQSFGLKVEFAEDQEKRLRAAYESSGNYFINDDIDMGLKDIVDMLTKIAEESLSIEDDFKDLDVSECIGEFTYPEEWRIAK